MGLWTLLEGLLLVANGLAILNEDRFLGPRGWSLSEFSSSSGGGGRRAKSFKGQLIGLIYATQYMRVPLIILNSICIVLMSHRLEPRVMFAAIGRLCGIKDFQKPSKFPHLGHGK